MTLVIFLLVLSFLVLIHELGHLAAALYYKVKVEEFGIGYPPMAVRLFRWKGIDFTLNWLPFGGFVRMEGEEREAGGIEKVALKVSKRLTGLGDGWGVFYEKRKYQRIVVIAAGAVMNFVFGIVAFSVVYSMVGIPTQMPGVEIGAVQENTPAAEAGVMVGDVVGAVEYEQGRIEVGSVDRMMEVLAEARGETVKLELMRGEEEVTAEVYVRMVDEVPEGQGSIGVAISDRMELVKPVWWQRPILGAWEGLKAAAAFGMMIVVALGGMLRQLFTAGTVPGEVSGPVGIVYTASRQGILEEGWLAIVHFAGVLSINLAVVNVLPIPALDGGRIVFIFLEKALGNRFKPVYEHYANLAGFALLLTLIVLVSLRDVGVILKDYGVGIGSFTKFWGG